MNRMISTALIAAPLATFATFAQAGGLAEPIAAPQVTQAPAPQVAPARSTGGEWGGFYVGGSLGYADISEDDNENFDDDDVTYGAFAGYDYDFGTFVVGGEVEISGFENSDNGVDVDSVIRGKVRVGYDAGNFLPYIVGGYASLDTGGAFDGSDEGFLYGAGVEYSFTDQINVGAEVLQHEFNNFDDTDFDIEATTISARVSYKF